jgi:type IV pilus assembly protein PilA
MLTQKRGFTLIELMIVVAIIGILGTMVVPTYQDFVVRSQIAEAMQLSDGVKRNIAEFYSENKRFPQDNAEAGVPQAAHLIGNYVTGISVEQGAIHITLGNRINAQVKGKVLSLQPAVVTANAESPISWTCGYAQAVEGMTAHGTNKTDIPAPYLLLSCREWKA